MIRKNDVDPSMSGNSPSKLDLIFTSENSMFKGLETNNRQKGWHISGDLPKSSMIIAYLKAQT